MGRPFLNIIEVGETHCPPLPHFVFWLYWHFLFQEFVAGWGLGGLPEGSYNTSDPSVVKPVNMLSVSGCSIFSLPWSSILQALLR
ncbi:MAG: hypothetical protein R3B93_08175 [Bacteroidia bacterium]